jgi:hypothetical protein
MYHLDPLLYAFIFLFSSLFSTFSGVPQGSTLGHHLFNVLLMIVCENSSF